jgi:hypothetical protein
MNRRWVKNIFLAAAISAVLTLRLAPVSFAAPVSSAAENGKPAATTDFESLFRTCENDWVAYERQLERLRKTWQKQVEAMSDKEFKALNEANDPRLVMISFHWPLDLQGKDPLWGAFKECSQKNYAARKELGKADIGASARKKRSEKVDMAEECALRNYNKEALIAPLDALIKCYRAQAAK